MYFAERAWIVRIVSQATPTFMDRKGAVNTFRALRLFSLFCLFRMFRLFQISPVASFACFKFRLFCPFRPFRIIAGRYSRDECAIKNSRQNAATKMPWLRLRKNAELRVPLRSRKPTAFSWSVRCTNKNEIPIYTNLSK